MRSHALALACAAALAIPAPSLAERGPLLRIPAPAPFVRPAHQRVGVGADATPLPLASDALLHSARMWEAHDRGDLARLALEKLVAARPDSADALLELGELNLRMADIPAAGKVLKIFDARFDRTPQARTFATAYRLATRDRLQLASIQRLLQIDQGAKARQEIHRVFGAAPDDGMVALEYYRLLAGTPGGWQPTHVGLKRLVDRHPDDPRYQLAMARHLLRRDETAVEGLRQLHALLQRDDVRATEIDDALSSAIAGAGHARVPPEILRAYAIRHPQDTAVSHTLAQEGRAREQQELVARNALASIEPKLQAENLTAARSVASTVADQQALLLLDALAGRPVDVDRIEDPVLAAAVWRHRATASVEARRPELAALQMQAAVAFLNQDFEAAIPLAAAMEAHGATNESDAVLRTASRLDPQSGWLFGTYTRWLIAHDRAGEALALLDARAVSSRWSAVERDALVASALDARARESIAHGRETAATADLERAIRLQPNDAWLRYRLAGVYARAGQLPRARQLLSDGLAAQPSSLEMRYALALFQSSHDDPDGALATLDALAPAERTDGMNELHVRLMRERDLDRVRTLQRDRQFAAAAQVLDDLIARAPDERPLRVARAELDLAAGNAPAARDRFAVLVAEDPDDVDARLSYVRALTETGDLPLARLQLQAARERIADKDPELQLTLARRELALGESTRALDTLKRVLAQTPDRADALLLAARAELSQRHFDVAADYFERAERATDADVASAARVARAQLDARLESWTTGGIEMRHKPGDGGISRFDSVVMPTQWQFARDYDQRVWLRADAVTLDAGRLSPDYDDAALLGTIQAAGPSAERRYDNDRQTGLSLGVGYTTDRFTVDVGTTPLGFLLPQILGGVEWTPEIGTLDLSLGLSRRAVTSSVLSYAGMRDPITGKRWGGVVDSGAYGQVGLYRERYSVSGSARVSKLTGDDVKSNRFVGSRLAADYKVVSWPDDRAYVGVALNYWNYAHDLSNYTFGSGGYYSPQAYWSVSLPLEWQGRKRDWSYRFRASISHSASRTDRTAFYVDDAALQAAASASTLPSGYDEAYFDGGRSSGTSLSAYAAVERQISRALVLGAKLDIDRADYYEPTVFMLYARHVFGRRATQFAMPPRPARAYVEER
ncbi:MAG TPA: cellulose synthase subunit BcsC-related outer membrane protein [Steroidobacteraceae bacterium]|nr:cellulose synthase subunit BcsC-related outer membrane protein [Steroidobacteraceae bacterium]